MLPGPTRAARWEALMSLGSRVTPRANRIPSLRSSTAAVSSPSTPNHLAATRLLLIRARRLHLRWHPARPRVPGGGSLAPPVGRMPRTPMLPTSVLPPEARKGFSTPSSRHWACRQTRIGPRRYPDMVAACMLHTAQAHRRKLSDSARTCPRPAPATPLSTAATSVTAGALISIVVSHRS